MAGFALPDCAADMLPKRLFGLETEYGCLVREDAAGTPEQIAHAVKEHVFRHARQGLIDLHARDFTFEPARSGGFLTNGARLYVDAVGDHEEYATAECRSLRDLAANDLAGQRIIQSALDALELTEHVSFYNNSVDHFGGHTFGCHENYFVRLDDDFFREGVDLLLPFLVTRQLFTGVGRVGGHRLNRSDFSRNLMTFSEYEIDYIWVHNFYAVEDDPSVEFQLSQRADHILKAVASKVRFNRAIINPKWDTAYSYGESHRLHLLFGEANMSQWATAMKVGTTSLVLELLEQRAVPNGVQVGDPVATLREVSRDPTFRWPVRLADGHELPAVELQRRYLAAAQQRFAGRDVQTDWVLQQWDYALAGLETDPYLLDDRVDWVAKRRLLELFQDSEGAGWRDDVMYSLDLEYHNINPSTSLSAGLLESGQLARLVPSDVVEAAVGLPPGGTRAAARGEAVRRLLDRGIERYVIDWDAVYLEHGVRLDLRNPFDTGRRQLDLLPDAR